MEKMLEVPIVPITMRESFESQLSEAWVASIEKPLAISYSGQNRVDVYGSRTEGLVETISKTTFSYTPIDWKPGIGDIFRFEQEEIVQGQKILYVKGKAYKRIESEARELRQDNLHEALIKSRMEFLSVPCDQVPIPFHRITKNIISGTPLTAEAKDGYSADIWLAFKACRKGATVLAEYKSSDGKAQGIPISFGGLQMYT